MYYTVLIIKMRLEIVLTEIFPQNPSLHIGVLQYNSIHKNNTFNQYPHGTLLSPNRTLGFRGKHFWETLRYFIL